MKNMLNRDFSGSISIAASDFSKEKRFWLKKMSGDLQKSCFPYDHIKRELNKTDSRTLSNKDTPDLPRLLRYSGEKLMGDIYNKLLKLSKNSDYVLQMILIAGVIALLNKYSGNEDIIIGTPIYKQEKEEEFLNTVLPLRIILKDLLSFKELLIIVRESMVEANENQNYPIETMLFQLNMSYIMDEFPLFDVAILLENLQDVNYILHTYPNIIFSFFRDENGIQCLIEYNAFKYEKSTIERVCRHFSHLLNVAINDLDIPISQFEILSDKEKEQLLVDFNSTISIYPNEKAIDELFEDQVKKNPNTIAVTFEGKPLTYCQLNKEADILAANLNFEGIQLEEPIALMVNDSYQIIVAILSILKAGGSYVPLNIDYPIERKKYILNDCNIKRLITNDSSLQEFPLNLSITVLDKNGSNRNSNPNNITRRHNGDNLAYIMYTSGSTGKPKGVMVRHRSAVRLVKNTNYIEFNNGDSILLTGALEFDASTFEIWGALLNGLPLHLTYKNTLLNHELLKEAISNLQVTTMWMTSPLFNQIVDTDINLFSGIQKLLVGGDVLSPVQINRFRKHYPEIIIINGYGPTENTTFSTTFRVDKEYKENIPIGKPISNSTVFILDSNYYLIPIGVRGELFVGGDGISRGYLNNPELTSEQFQNNPIYFRKDLHKQKIPHTGTLYKTGDFSRWLSDGNIEFLGRKDHQVKIRGFRIEPGEIENHLRRIDFIRDAVVLDLKNTEGEKYLCAYIILDKKKSDFIDIIELKHTLSQQLPDYMIPTYLIPLENIPLKNNGKVDRKALPEPEKIDLHTTYIPPRTSIEKKFVEIWSEILRIDKERIGIDTDFFELGGHSLKATILISKLHEAFNVKLPLVEIFRTPNIRELAIYIHTLKGERFTSIFPYEKKEYYGLSSAQRRLYYLQEFKPDSTAYNIPVAYILKGEVDRRKWEEAFRELIQRHESLRTSFRIIDEKLVQIVHDIKKFEIEYYDLLSKDNNNALYKKLLVDKDKTNFNLSSIISNPQAGFIFPFDLSKAPLLKIRMILLEKKQYLLMIDIHHIIIDGSSLGIFIKEFSNLYKSEKPNALKIQYKDYSQWQNCISQQKKYKEQENYWDKQFESEIQTLKLPLDYSRSSTQSFEGSTIDFKFTHQQFKNFNRFALEQGATLYMVLLTFYYILLYKLSDQEDIVVGTPIAARSHSDLEQVIGMFVNTLPLRNFPHGQKQFSQFLKEVKRNTVKAFENQDYPFEDMVERFNPMRDTSRNPFFDTMFTLQNFETLSIKIPKLKVKRIEYKAHISKFDLTFTAFEHKGTLLFIIEYCTKLFKEETIRRFADFFVKITSIVIQTPNIKICEIAIIDEKEKNRILFEFNNTAADYPKDKTIPQLFEEQVKLLQNKVAIVGNQALNQNSNSNFKESSLPIVNAINNVQLTYDFLNEESNQLTIKIMEKNIYRNSIVGIMIKRPIEMVIGIISILKAGSAYLAINPDYPQERIDYMLKDSATDLILSTSNLSETGWNKKLWKSQRYQETLFLNFLYAPPQKTLNNILRPFSKPTSSAYIIFTSGSTGKPKAVIVQHMNVVRLVKNTKYIEFNPEDCLLPTGALEFDASTFELWGSLLNGMSLFLVDNEIILSSKDFKYSLQKYRITTIWLTSPLFNQLLDQDTETFSSLKNLLVGGDILSPSHINRLRAKYPLLNIINGYGPTENTTFSTTYIINKEHLKNIPIGKPISNSTVYILDRYNQPLPIGIVGELFVGGDGVAKGYLNNPESTCEKFIYLHPFELWKIILNKRDLANQHNKKEGLQCRNKRLYRTGDLARWLQNGNIEFIGRIDFQVKIRGFRVELGEIENKLLRVKGINDAVVIIQEKEEGDKYIYAYFTSGIDIDTSALRRQMSMELPDYMIPSFFLKIEKIPLTSNGKVDDKALPVLGINTEELYFAPRNDVEIKLTEIWAEVLKYKKSKIGTNANFFELGGHSLKATHIITKIHKQFDVRLTLTDFFKHPQIKTLAQYIEGKIKEKHISIQPIEKKEYYSLSSAQKRIYILQQMHLNSIAYNIPAFIPLELDSDVKKIKKIFYKLIKQHENLRTSFKLINDEPKQIVKEEVIFNITYTTIEAKIEETCKNFVRAFDLSQTPLLRIGLIKFSPTQDNQSKTKFLLMVDMHHIISDGISIGLLIKDFQLLYEGEELISLRIQYKDFSQWQKGKKEINNIRQQEKFWLKEFEGEIPILKLPTDYPRPLEQSFKGKSINVEINEEDTQALMEITLKENSTLFIVLLSLIYILLSKLSGQEEIIIGTPIAARRHTDLEKIIGMFVNTLPLKNSLIDDLTFYQFLQNSKEKTLNAFENQEYPFEDLVDHLSVNRDIGRNPLFDIMFALQNLDNPNIEILDSQPSLYKFINLTAKFDLTIFAIEKNNSLIFTFKYCTDLFAEPTIKKFIRYFKKIISTITKTKNEKIKLSTIEIITIEEKKQILYTFNDTEINYPKHKTIYNLFKEQMEKSPDHIAIVGNSIVKSDGNRSSSNGNSNYCFISYKHLNYQSNLINLLLIKEGIKPETIVGIMSARAVEVIIGIMGILKAGGAYLPIDPLLPEERKQYILKESNTKILLTGEEITKPELIKTLNKNIQNLYTHPFLTVAPTPSLAYVLYTSGTMGKPKGVMVKHQSVVNLIFNMKKTIFRFTNPTAIALISPLFFDASIKQIFPTLSFGHRLVIATDQERLDGEKLLTLYLKQNIKLTDGTPAHLTLLIETISNFQTDIDIPVEKFVIGGDILKPSQVELFFQIFYKKHNYKKIELINAYGPTECCDVSSTFLVPRKGFKQNSSISIGTPIDNVKIFILGKTFDIKPIGIVGEIFIGGDCVSLGYIDQPELTVEKYIHVILNSDSSGIELKVILIRKPIHITSTSILTLYRTGDIGRWMSDGKIEFLGRSDLQVKIRGFRIELGEIENSLLSISGLKEAVVSISEESDDDKHIYAYYIAERDYKFSELHKSLLTKLPDYMIPAYFIRLNEIPLTSNGKVNYKALPKSNKTTEESYVPPRNKVETKLVEIWAELLGIDKETISIYSNFFELGGHSLKATILISKIHKEFEIKIPVAEIFKSPRIGTLSEYINGKIKETYFSIKSVEKKEYYPISSAQRRLYILQQMHLNRTAYNIRNVMVLEEGIDLNVLEKTFKKLIERHDSLRTFFIETEGKLIQRICDIKDIIFNLESVDLNTKLKSKGKFDLKVETKKTPFLETESAKLSSDPLTLETLINSFIKPFNLSQAPLLRVGLIHNFNLDLSPHAQIQKDTTLYKHILVIDMHHIITDGVSQQLLIEDFISMYNGKTLPPIKFQYKDFSEWQRIEKQKESFLKQKTYWLNQFLSQPQVLNLPTDYKRPEKLTRDGRRLTFLLEENIVKKIKHFLLETKTTLYMFLLTVYYILLFIYTKQEDIIVGSPVAGRKHNDLHNTVGMFVNMLAIRNRPQTQKTFKRFLKEVKKSALEAFENQEYQFEELVEKIDIPRNPGRRPLVETVFTMQNTFNPVNTKNLINNKRLKVKPLPSFIGNIMFDLTLDAIEINNSIKMWWTYSVELFKHLSIEKFRDHYIEIVKQVLENSNQKICEINISNTLNTAESNPLKNDEGDFEF